MSTVNQLIQEKRYIQFKEISDYQECELCDLGQMLDDLLTAIEKESSGKRSNGSLYERNYAVDGCSPRSHGG